MINDFNYIESSETHLYIWSRMTCASIRVIFCEPNAKRSDNKYTIEVYVPNRNNTCFGNKIMA